MWFVYLLCGAIYRLTFAFVKRRAGPLPNRFFVVTCVSKWQGSYDQNMSEFQHQLFSMSPVWLAPPLTVQNNFPPGIKSDTHFVLLWFLWTKSLGHHNLLKHIYFYQQTYVQTYVMCCIKCNRSIRIIL